MIFAGIPLKLKIKSMSILAIRSNKRRETVSIPKHGLKSRDYHDFLNSIDVRTRFSFSKYDK